MPSPRKGHEAFIPSTTTWGPPEHHALKFLVYSFLYLKTAVLFLLLHLPLENFLFSFSISSMILKTLIKFYLVILARSLHLGGSRILWHCESHTSPGLLTSSPIARGREINFYLAESLLFCVFCHTQSKIILLYLWLFRLENKRLKETD